MFRESTYIEADGKAGKGGKPAGDVPGAGPDGRARRSDLKPMRRLLPYLLPYRWAILAATVALVVTADTGLPLLRLRGCAVSRTSGRVPVH